MKQSPEEGLPVEWVNGAALSALAQPACLALGRRPNPKSWQSVWIQKQLENLKRYVRWTPKLLLSYVNLSPDVNGQIAIC